MRHTCDAHRSMRSMQRTSTLYNAWCSVRSMQHAATAYYTQHTARTIPAAALRPQTPALAQMQHALRSIQRAGRKPQACNVQHTHTHTPSQQHGLSEERRYSYLTTCSNLRTTCNTEMQRAHTPYVTSNIHAWCAAQVATCTTHHATVHRSPCNSMRHAQLSATRIAHRRRACDAAALEADRPTIHYHHATNLQTAAPFHLRPDRPPHATRTPTEVSEIATSSNVALLFNMSSTPPTFCTRAQDAPSLRDDDNIPHARCNVQRAQCNKVDATEATCNGTHAACFKTHGTPHDASGHHPSATRKRTATRCILSTRCNTQHATCPLQRRQYDTHHATAPARKNGLRIRRPRAPVIRTQLQASGKRDQNGPPLAA